MFARYLIYPAVKSVQTNIYSSACKRHKINKIKTGKIARDNLLVDRFNVHYADVVYMKCGTTPCLHSLPWGHLQAGAAWL